MTSPASRLVEWHDTLPSTMTRARELSEAGAPPGTVVAARYQSEGRGTRGRVWLAPPGTCLMFTIILPPPPNTADLATLPYRVSASIADWLSERFGLACAVKEPNDILINGRKVCGVLCTSRIVGDRIAHVLCGVGLNPFMTREQLPLETATSLLIEGVDVPAHEVLLGEVVERVMTHRA
jgi:BirA family biotin operon repressor/biotin-[acetyl-CoA-carboxylase] ligase